MKDKKDIHKELEELAPFLSKMDKKEDFIIPENYFEPLQNEVLDKIQEEEKIISPNSSLKMNRSGRFQHLFSPRIAAGIAAMVLLAVASYLFFNTTDNQVYMSSIEEISNEEISAYITANIDEFDEELLINVDDDFDINILEFNTYDFDSSFDEFLDDVDIETLEKLL